MRTLSTQRSALLPLLQAHLRGITARFPGATPCGIGRPVHADDRRVLERHCSALRLQRPGALVQALPAGRGRDPVGLGTCAQVAATRERSGRTHTIPSILARTIAPDRFLTFSLL